MFWPAKKTKLSYYDGQIIELDGYVLRLKVNARTKRIALRIDNKTSQAVLSVPRLRDLAQAVDFAHERREWIVSKISSRPQRLSFEPEMSISCLGQDMVLNRSSKLVAARLDENHPLPQLICGGEGAAFHRRIEKYLKLKALDFATNQTLAYAQRLNIEGAKISLFDPKGRWGSCTPTRKAIRLSWRLALAPVHVFDYVCAHEAAHLRHAHHGPDFWAEVERLFGPHKPARAWLKSHGQSLFAYGL